jgi:hypothetical protein
MGSIIFSLKKSDQRSPLPQGSYRYSLSEAAKDDRKLIGTNMRNLSTDHFHHSFTFHVFVRLWQSVSARIFVFMSLLFLFVVRSQRVPDVLLSTGPSSQCSVKANYVYMKEQYVKLLNPHAFVFHKERRPILQK